MPRGARLWERHGPNRARVGGSRSAQRPSRLAPAPPRTLTKASTSSKPGSTGAAAGFPSLSCSAGSPPDPPLPPRASGLPATAQPFPSPTAAAILSPQPRDAQKLSRELPARQGRERKRGSAFGWLDSAKPSISRPLAAWRAVLPADPQPPHAALPAICYSSACLPLPKSYLGINKNAAHFSTFWCNLLAQKYSNTTWHLNMATLLYFVHFF